LAPVGKYPVVDEKVLDDVVVRCLSIDTMRNLLAIAAARKKYKRHIQETYTYMTVLPIYNAYREAMAAKAATDEKDWLRRLQIYLDHFS
jgi:hypothetical protein